MKEDADDNKIILGEPDDLSFLKKPNFVFLAMYNPMIHESSYGIISVHKTQKGAEMAIEFNKNDERNIWLEEHPNKKDQEEFPFGKYQNWKVEKVKLEE